jgi:hypothetical protein
MLHFYFKHSAAKVQPKEKIFSHKKHKGTQRRKIKKEFQPRKA